MSRNYYSEINLHFVWHTKNNQPLLTPNVEFATHRYIRPRIVNTPEVFIHEISGTETHIHLCVTIPPTLMISKFVGELKGSSSHEVNQGLCRQQKVLRWQTGYGVVSFGTRDMEWVKSYVRNQREHHRTDSIHDRLERITHDDDKA